MCEGNVAKSGTMAAADKVVNAEAATEHTRKQRGTYEGNATISMKLSMKLYERKNLYTLVKKKERSKTYHEDTNAV